MRDSIDRSATRDAPPRTTEALAGETDPRRRRRRRLAAAVLGFLTAVGLVTLTPTAAQAAPVRGFAYVWADQPTAAAYTPSPPYSRNSTGGTNTITHDPGVGRYTVHFPGLGLPAGIVHVTAYGPGANFCTVVDWNPGGPPDNLNVRVRCFNTAGAGADTRFTASFVNASGGGAPLAYLWADRPGNPVTPPAYQFNSAGGTNTVNRTGVGEYTAQLPLLGASAGHVQVTAYGAAPARCKVVGWGPSGTTQLVNVRCFNAAGALQNHRFTLTYARNTSILRITPAAYAWADSPTAGVYIPSASYRFNSFGGTNTIRRLGTGVYRVETFGQPLGNGYVAVTAYGTSADYCKVVSWTPTNGIQVTCFTAAGAPVDSRFDVVFLR
jgi:hypothetical protein